MNVFNTNFVDNLKQTLETKLEEQKAIQRKDLCKAMDLDEKYQDIISFVISNNVLSGYEIIPGRYGGVAKEGTKGTKTKGASRAATVKLSDEFVNALRETLFELCSDGGNHFRSAVAEAMGQPGAATEKAISDAFNLGKLPEFQIVRGRYGGIKLRDEEVVDSIKPSDDEDVNEEESVNTDGELMVADNQPEDTNSIDLSDYDLNDLDDEVKNILMQHENGIQGINSDSETL